LLITLPLIAAGANAAWAVTPERIDYRSLGSLATRTYQWSAVSRIETSCYAQKSDQTYRFVLVLKDGTRLDLMEESPEDFVAAYPLVQSALARTRYSFDASGMVGACSASAPRRWQAVLLNRPTPAN
jgi:hypothetical protein